MDTPSERSTAEARFARVFEHLPAVVAYARRRGSGDPEGLAAETMAIAWRRLADVPVDEPRPWLLATARNLIWAEWRRAARERRVEEPAAAEQPLAAGIDPALERALLTLSRDEREAVLLVAWDDLSPALAARCLGINATAFRVRLHRARRRLREALADADRPVGAADLEVGHA
jgi:RNA polymerase sigma-70 factor (ECF subfamily)